MILSDLNDQNPILLNSNSPFIATVLPSLDRTFPGMLADLDWHFTPYGKMPVMFVRLYWHTSVEALPLSAEWGLN